MLFYTSNADGSIKEYSNYKFDENAIETDRNIIVDFTGHYIFEEETSTKDYQEKLQKYNNELESQQKILELKNWFDTNYRTYCEMLTRRQALGIDDKIVDQFRNKTYTNLTELYEEAEVVSKEIRELRK